MRRWVSERGTAPLELIAWAALLLLTLLPTIELQRALSHQLAAEAIARHSLRSALLAESELASGALLGNLERTAREIAATFQLDPNQIRLDLDCRDCDSELIRLAVTVQGARAVAIMPLEPGD